MITVLVFFVWVYVFMYIYTYYAGIDIEGYPIGPGQVN